MKPTIGRIVLYVLSESDASAINTARQTTFAHENKGSDVAPTCGFIRQGNTANEGDIYPADVVRVFDVEPEVMINLQVKLDGNDSFWATSRHESDEKTPGTWHWMEYQKGQAAKADAAQKELDETIKGYAAAAGVPVIGADGEVTYDPNDIHRDGIADPGEAGTDDGEKSLNKEQFEAIQALRGNETAEELREKGFHVITSTGPTGGIGGEPHRQGTEPKQKTEAAVSKKAAKAKKDA